MPIRPENRGRYPKNWKEISLRIRFQRAEGRCECLGQCGLDHSSECETGRCTAEHGKPHPVTGSTVILTTAHFHHAEIEDVGDEDLFAGCQRCHNRYDAPKRAEGIRERREEAARLEREKILRKAGVMAFEAECATGRKVAR